MRMLRNHRGTWALLGADGLILAIGSWEHVQGVMKSWTH
jgi:hypothetical protein